MIKWIGALFVIGSCGMFGLSMAASHRREEMALHQMMAALDYMQCELQYRLTPLPDLCRQAGQHNRNLIGNILLMLAREMDCCISPDAERCIEAALSSGAELPRRSRQAFEMLGSTLGCFDVEGQVRGLDAVRSFCQRELDALALNRDSRLRSYQTLGFCAGAAIAILFV